MKYTKSIEGFIKEVHLSFAHVEGAYAKDGVKGEAHAHVRFFGHDVPRRGGAAAMALRAACTGILNR